VSPGQVHDACPSALLVDLYELTMMQAYWSHGVHGSATFDLFIRQLPLERNFLLTAGLDSVLEILEHLRFTAGDISYLRSLGLFDGDFLDSLVGFGFSGSVDAMPEGTVAFGGEPILRVTAPIIEGQFFETVIVNQIHLQTLLASKAARIVLAAAGRKLVDFGLRRMHGTDAGTAGARAFWIAGFDATSNVLAGQLFGLPVAGTMAHSFVQCHRSELDAFRDFAASFPETTLLVDTYDTLRGVDRVISLAHELGDEFRVRAVRLDSGDLAGLAKKARRRLDAAGLDRVQIFASGNLDEHRVRRLLHDGAPIDGFGVGTRLGTSEDVPNLEAVYKLAQLDDRALLKLSTDKATLPGVKQVWRRTAASGVFDGDLIGLADEELGGRPLLVPVMRGGRRLETGREKLAVIRRRASAELAMLPEPLRRLEPADPPYRVEVSDELRLSRDTLAGAMTV